MTGGPHRGMCSCLGDVFLPLACNHTDAEDRSHWGKTTAMPLRQVARSLDALVCKGPCFGAAHREAPWSGLDWFGLDWIGLHCLSSSIFQAHLGHQSWSLVYMVKFSRRVQRSKGKEPPPLFETKGLPELLNQSVSERPFVIISWSLGILSGYFGAWPC